MCGIAGVISAAPLDEPELAALRRLNGALAHRGPDSDGFVAFEHAALAMRRLSIVDLAGGTQPLYSEDGAIALVANGEIYNHRDLRADLALRQHRFRSGSDVETIIHLYEDRGVGCLEPLRGMFAFALWDGARRRLLLARDRMGEKPLYLYRDRRADGAPRLWFASELTALLGLVPPPQRRLSPAVANEFLTFQYALEPDSPIEGIVQLPPGHFLMLSPEDLDAAPERYWSMLEVAPAPQADPVEAVRGWLDEACRRMGTADVPVGVALSGGVDSSLVAAVAAKHYPGQIHAFSVGYAGRPQNDERAIAGRFAEAIGIPFNEIEIDVAEMSTAFPALVRAMDTPVADIAGYGYFCVARAARAAGVPVLLSGLGGDEFFWGYEWVREAARARANGGSNGHAATVRDGWWRRLFGEARLRRDETSIFLPHEDLRRGDALSRGLLTDPASVPAAHWLSETRPADGVPAGIAVSEALNRTWLVANCLTLADRMSMANSIEMRVPFLDIDLVCGVSAMRQAGLDDWAKPHKWLLLEAWGHLLPDEIKHRPKQGFTPPVQSWIKALVDRWRPLWEQDSRLARAGLFDQKALAAAARTPLFFQYKLTVLELWARAALDGEIPS